MKDETPPLQLVVVRHAIAVDRIASASEQDDALRPLTDRGRRRFKQAVRGLHRLGIRVDLVLTSPWTRAVQTGALLAPIVAGKPDGRRTTVHLAGAPRGELLAELAGPARIAVVGHEPWLGELVALLTTGNAQHGAVLRLKKGGVVILEGEPATGKMQLVAMLPPRVLRSIG
jgi:phosphohistidine phosphatase